MQDLGKQVLEESTCQTDIGAILHTACCPSAVVTETSYSPGTVLHCPGHNRPLFVLMTHGEYSETLGSSRSEKCVPGILRYIPANVKHADNVYGGAQGLVVRIKSVLMEHVKSLTVLESRSGNLDGPEFDNLGRQLLMEFRRNDDATPLAL